ncbi:unnamed protein product, partial [marine sediment metagenome]
MPAPLRKRWIKLWTQELLYGTISKELTLEQQAIWIKLLALAGDSPIPGTICLAPDVPYPMPSLAKVIGTDLNTLEIALKRIASEEVSEITISNGFIHICNWKSYQEFDRLAYMRKYMRQYRGEKIEEEGKQVAEAKGPPTAIPHVKLPGQEEATLIPIVIAKLAQNYEAEIGVITGLISQELADYAQQHVQANAPLPWIDEAFAEAAKNNKRNWAYVRAILNAWIGKGKAGKTKREEQVEREWRERQE